MSAGSQPTGEVHPRSLALLAREGISARGCHSKSWDNLPATPDIVLTVCSSAAGETCPAYLGSVLRSHWGVDDPAKATGTEAQIEAAFESAYRMLRRGIESFFALPLGELTRDRAHLKTALDHIVEQYEKERGRKAPWGFQRIRVHDLKHTFGRRLRAAGVPEETRKVLLGHKNGDITTHYSAAELRELIEAVQKIDASRETPVITLLRPQQAVDVLQKSCKKAKGRREPTLRHRK